MDNNIKHEAEDMAFILIPNPKQNDISTTACARTLLVALILSLQHQYGNSWRFTDLDGLVRETTGALERLARIVGESHYTPAAHLVSTGDLGTFTAHLDTEFGRVSSWTHHKFHKYRVLSRKRRALVPYQLTV